SLPAETQSDHILKIVESTINVRLDTQKKVDQWANKKAEFTSKYRSLENNLENLRKVKLKTGKMLNYKNAHIKEIKRKIKESSRIKIELGSYLESVAVNLEGFIRRDLPFLLEERERRITLVKNTLIDQNKTPAEKYRSLMEALQIEEEYGHTVEVYQDTINLNGKKLLVDILRVGRLSLFFQTPDGKIVGQYDRVAYKWSKLPSRYCRRINKAVEIAHKESTIELIKLPIGRIIVP
ncbi:MAG: DUF3450 domain-containing protein, partial [Thermodesulfobacteriota bacterium]|nr:DUF3450 domain-containing protein [Thermodesulfobacteriota bacterium]